MQQQQQQQFNPVEVSSISCQFCRSQHRRCSKTKPSCYSCVMRGVECIYGSGKRKKRNNEEMDQMMTVMKVVPTPHHHQEEFQQQQGFPMFTFPFQKPPQSSSASLSTPPEQQTIKSSSSSSNSSPESNNSNQIVNSRSERLQIVDFYFEVACFAHPIVSRSELEKFVEISALVEGEFDTPFMNEMAALFYSIKTVCEITQGKQPDETASIAKRYLSNSFANYSSFYIAGAYFHMCIYELLQERLDKAQLYFRILLFFKQSLFKNPNASLNEYQLNVKKAIFYLEKIVFKVDQNVKQIMTVEDFLDIIPDLFVFNSTSLPAGWDACLKQPITSENCLEVWTLVELILTQAKIHTPFKTNPELSDLYYRLAENGSRIALLSKKTTKSSIIELSIEASAFYIAQSLDHPRFSLLPFEVLLHVSYAAEYHLQKVDSGIITNNGINYLDLLRKELHAYNSLKSKYRIVAFHFSQVFEKIESLLNQHNSHLTFIH
ncbi:hypothetical protein NAEGRDRAFT_81991 [Naegleria gruberi]|uniref:Zn(2)-C6 fungal-type domain-containing protein n=1 Tax=Naegleria gruberi TaxID=5762 RepID=D2W118_NAEGR|nr:uncharacterized protein NAEGRDRAFT_81991 [Naegleria gruberi]EFC37282.1 hypothetical protein NAEGRDRAFT_81991 [Naegleria gruberi]|eukprot:XP_002670026.1 hypothetical protein NAEGRDRAFT_81991 [Naegleria gruberi strain NEG-M]